MYPCKLRAPLKDYLWGGSRLKTEWGKRTDKDVVAESWELSVHPDGQSVIENGELAGKTLLEALALWPEAAGTDSKRFPMFPVLVKLIDSKQNLSIQVHPSDAYALEHEGQFGKTEMWYIVAAEPGAGIYYGFNRDVTGEEYLAAIENGTVTELLNFVQVVPGQTYFIESGTVHAIGAGLLICEIQQNSNITYRVYDYGRVGADGKPRQLHVEKAVQVSNLRRQPPLPLSCRAVERGGARVTELASCRYFAATEVCAEKSYTGYADTDSFQALTFLFGEGTLDGLKVQKGDTVFLPAGYGDYRVEGNVRFLLSRTGKEA